MALTDSVFLLPHEEDFNLPRELAERVFRLGLAAAQNLLRDLQVVWRGELDVGVLPQRELHRQPELLDDGHVVRHGEVPQRHLLEAFSQQRGLDHLEGGTHAQRRTGTQNEEY